MVAARKRKTAVFSELDPMDQEPIIIGGPLLMPDVLVTNCVLSAPPEIEDMERSSPADIGVVIGATAIAPGDVGVCVLVWLVFMLVLALEFAFLKVSRASTMLSSFPVTPKIPPSIFTDSQVL